MLLTGLIALSVDLVKYDIKYFKRVTHPISPLSRFKVILLRLHNDTTSLMCGKYWTRITCSP